MSAFAPVALFGYDRSDHLKKTVEHLRANELASSTAVYVFSDGAKNSQARLHNSSYQTARRAARYFITPFIYCPTLPAHILRRHCP
jgi:hypothetical protein